MFENQEINTMSNQTGRVVTLSMYLLDPQKQHNMGECIGIHFYVAYYLYTVLIEN